VRCLGIVRGSDGWCWHGIVGYGMFLGIGGQDVHSYKTGKLRIDSWTRWRYSACRFRFKQYLSKLLLLSCRIAAGALSLRVWPRPIGQRAPSPLGPGIKKSAAPRSPPTVSPFLSPTLFPSFTSLPAGLPFWLTAPPPSGPAAPGADRLPSSNRPSSPSCSHPTLPRLVDSTVGMAVDGDADAQSVLPDQWPAVHAMATPSASCPRYLTSSSTPPSTTRPLPEAPATQRYPASPESPPPPSPQLS
jgi:hypothetical protein